MHIIELPYRVDTLALFAEIAHEPWAVYLDSCFPHSQQGRYDIIAAQPSIVLETHAATTYIHSQGAVKTSNEDPLYLLQKILGPIRENLTGLPFCGGAIGFFSYDLARRLDLLPYRDRSDLAIPEMAIGIYDWAIVADHHQQRISIACYDETIAQSASWRTLVQRFRQLPPNSIPIPQLVNTGALTANMDEATYSAVFARIKRYIEQGDCYQVNLAIRFMLEQPPNPWLLYALLRQKNPAPYSCYFNAGKIKILSNSPECFLRVQQQLVETKPIKGTRPRLSDAKQNNQMMDELRNSAKDRAENLMIVDLMRNDLGKVCITGSVTVPQLFNVESFSSVHHLVSTVTGRLPKNTHALSLLRSCFPGGSITGAPKIRAMQIIDELEMHQRHVYCGSIGYIGFDGNMDCSIAIRSLIHQNNRLYFWGGGGIVSDSIARLEYQECFDKIAPFITLLNS